MADPPRATLTLRPDASPPGRRGDAFLVLALECDRPCSPPSRWALADVDRVLLCRGAERGAARSEQGGLRSLEVRVADARVSTTHARLHRAGARWVVDDGGSKNGTILDGAPVQSALLSDGALLEIGHTLLLFRDGAAGTGGAGDLDAARAPAPAPGLATLSPPLQRLFDRVAVVARSTLSVVVSGESGTGKEVLARAVHELSGRAGPFVAVNCGALPAALVESELFGYRRGAFSGALEDRPGLVRASHGGTLFLDEIGDLAPPAQAALLRVLQEREVLPVGATRPVAVDLRVVAATHRELEELVAQGRFRADLLARLSGFTLALPALRDRREDLGLLVATLLPRLAPEGGAGATLSVEAARALFRHGWPLNVRELERALAAAVVLARGGLVRPEHLPAAVTGATAPARGAPRAPPAAPARPLTAQEQERRAAIEALLREHRGNVSAVARATGKARMQIQRWLKRLGLDPEQFRS